MICRRLFRPLMMSCLLVATLATGGEAQSLSGFQAGIRGSGFSFIENRGQVSGADGKSAPEVLYRAEARGVGVMLRRSGISYVFSRAASDAPSHRELSATPDSVVLYRVDMDFIGTNPNVQVMGEGEESRTSFHLPAIQGGSGVAAGFSRVIYHNIYPSIDLLLYSTDGTMKYDLVVRPGGNPAAIRMRYTGATAVTLEEDGSAMIRTPFGTIREGRPRCFMQRSSLDGSEPDETVEGGYRVAGNELRFELAPYNRRGTLRIDPAVAWVTYYGGTGGETLNGMSWYRWTATGDGDSTGDFLVSGRSYSVAMPGFAGAPQVVPAGGNSYIAKIRARDGAALWTSVLGGSRDEVALGVAADRSGGSYICGTTTSNDFPTTSGAFQRSSGGGANQMFLAKFDSAGTLLWATYYGGAGENYGHAVAVDADQDVVLHGTTQSMGLGTDGTYLGNAPGPGTSHIVVKFSPLGLRRWATYYGSASGLERDQWGGVAVDPARNIYFTGGTDSPDFPTTPGAFQPARMGVAGTDGFLVKLDPNGQRLWATLLSGSNAEAGTSVVVDRAGSVYVGGFTNSIDLPVTAGAFQVAYSDAANPTANDGFVAAFDSAGARRWITYCGGVGDDTFEALAVNSRREVLAVGGTLSNLFPVTSDAWRGTPGGGGDMVGIKFDSTGARLYATYLGGTRSDAGSAALAGSGMFVVGGTTSGLFPVTANATQGAFGGVTDGLIAKFCDIPTMQVEQIGVREFCEGDSIRLRAPAGFRYRWSTGSTAQSITVKESGRYSFRAEFVDCSSPSDTVQVIVHPLPRPRLYPTGSHTICEGESHTLDGGPYAAWRWSNGAATRRITVSTPGTYSVAVTDSAGCPARSDTFTLNVRPRPIPQIFPFGPIEICTGDSVMLDAGAGYSAWRWNTGATSHVVAAKTSGRYSVAVRGFDGCWSDTTSVEVVVLPQTRLDWWINQPAEICEGDSFLVVLSGRFLAWGWSTGETSPRVVTRQGGLLRGWGIDSNGCTTSVAFDVRLSPTPHPVIAVDGDLHFCEGDSVTLDAGEGYGFYLWSDGSRGRTLVARQSGHYNVMVRSQAGCAGFSNGVSVEMKPRPHVDIRGPIAVCRGAVSLYSVPEYPGMIYSWSIKGAGQGASRTDSNGFAVQWGDLGTGSVHLHVHDISNGCGAEAILDVSIQDTLQPRVTSDRSPRLCPGGSVVLDAGEYASYLWSTGETTRTITVAAPGSFTVQVVEPGGCTGSSAPFEVTMALPVTPVVLHPEGTTLCRDRHLLLDAGGDYSSCVWSNGATGRTIVVADTGEYSVRVVDSNGCDGTSAPVRIERDPEFDPQIAGPRVVCRGAAVGYTATLRDGHDYEWRVEGGAIVSGRWREEITVDWGTGDSGRVTVVERSAAGCIDSTSIVVVLGDHLEPAVSPSGSLRLCQGDSARLDAGPGYVGYLWSTGETTRFVMVRSSGDYSVKVTDSKGCSGTSEPVTVAMVPLPVVAITPANPPAVCDGEVVVLRGTPGLRDYLWSSGETSDTLVVRRSGTYTLSAGNIDGCRASSVPVDVMILPPMTPPTISRRGDTLVAPVAERYQWIFNDRPLPTATSQRLVRAEAGLYRVVIVDRNGCTATSEIFKVNQVWQLHLDTINGNVGDPLRLTMRVSPPLQEEDAVTGYSVRLHADPRSLYMLRAEPGDPAAVAPTLLRDADGTVRLDLSGSEPLVGPVLFRVELYGLLTAIPTAPVAIESASLDPAGAVAAGDGLVLLRGCDVGHGLGFNRAVAITRVDITLSGDVLTIRYHAPKDSEPTIVMVDAVGRQMNAGTLPVSTGGEQTAVIRVGHLSTGLYRIELQARGERSVAPVVIVK